MKKYLIKSTKFDFNKFTMTFKLLNDFQNLMKF